ncbi:hypothetical protein BKA70DRAFT_526430 [Coprinopsis sp. MPI-PUGE-AT-0042]|nr:hypothetical protein BKA70DRAFT_526430 [Coprinopsis sp. MPI-PUGE-AT-0042]
MTSDAAGISVMGRQTIRCAHARLGMGLRPDTLPDADSLSEKMPSPLPRELLLEIVTFLEDDVDSLRELALASSVFRLPCQISLFSHISLSFDPSSPNPGHQPSNALADIYRQSPVLLTFAKSVTVRDLSGWTPATSLFPPTFTEVLTDLAKQGLEKVDVKWGGLWNPPIREALRALVQCPTLVSLHLSDLPIQLLDSIGSPHLGELSMYSMFNFITRRMDSIEGYVCPSLKPAIFHLRSLTLETGMHELKFAQDLNLTALRNLKLDDDGHPWPPKVFAGPLFASCATQLETLQFSIETIRWNPERFMSAETIGRLERLKELSVDCDTHLNDVNGRINHYLWLPNFLDHLPTPCSIRRLHLQLKFWEPREADQEVGFWNQIDATLAARQRFPKLAGVSVKIQVEMLEGEEEQERGSVPKDVATDTRRRFFPQLLSGNQLEDPECSDAMKTSE